MTKLSGRFGRFGLLRICCWELVLIAAVLGIGRPWPVAASVWFGALLVLVPAAVRMRGRWLSDWLALAVRYSARHRHVDLAAAGAPGPALLRLIAPEAAGSTETVGDEPVFMLSRSAGVTAVLRPAAAVPDPSALLRAPETRLSGDPAVAVQVVHHAGINRQDPPRTWLALQALRTVETYQDAELCRALGNSLRRVRRQLRRLGCPVSGLAEHEVLGTLAALAHVNGGRGRIREAWHCWQSGPVGQATFRMDGWAEAARSGGRQLTDWLLAATPYAATTISVTAYRASADAEPRVYAALRLAASRPETLAYAAGRLTETARHRAITLTRLDGQHAHGVSATLPIGLSGPVGSPASVPAIR